MFGRGEKLVLRYWIELARAVKSLFVSSPPVKRPVHKSQLLSPYTEYIQTVLIPLVRSTDVLAAAIKRFNARRFSCRINQQTRWPEPSAGDGSDRSSPAVDLIFVHLLQPSIEPLNQHTAFASHSDVFY